MVNAGQGPTGGTDAYTDSGDSGGGGGSKTVDTGDDPVDRARLSQKQKQNIQRQQRAAERERQRDRANRTETDSYDGGPSGERDVSGDGAGGASAETTDRGDSGSGSDSGGLIDRAKDVVTDTASKAASAAAGAATAAQERAQQAEQQRERANGGTGAPGGTEGYQNSQDQSPGGQSRTASSNQSSSTGQPETGSSGGGVEKSLQFDGPRSSGGQESDRPSDSTSQSSTRSAGNSSGSTTENTQRQVNEAFAQSDAAGADTIRDRNPEATDRAVRDGVETGEGAAPVAEQLGGDADGDGVAEFAEPETNPDQIDPNAAPGVVRDQIVQQEARDLETGPDGDPLTDAEIDAAFETAEALERRTNTSKEDTSALIQRPEEDTTQETARAVRQAESDLQESVASQSAVLDPEDVETSYERTEDGFEVNAEVTDSGQENLQELSESREARARAFETVERQAAAQEQARDSVRNQSDVDLDRGEDFRLPTEVTDDAVRAQVEFSDQGQETIAAEEFASETGLDAGADFNVEASEDGVDVSLTSSGRIELAGREESGETGFDRALGDFEDTSGVNIPGQGDVVQSVEADLQQAAVTQREGRGLFPSGEQAADRAASLPQLDFVGASAGMGLSQEMREGLGRRLGKTVNPAGIALGAGQTTEQVGEFTVDAVRSRGQIEQGEIDTEAQERVSNDLSTATGAGVSLAEDTAESVTARPEQTLGSAIFTGAAIAGGEAASGAAFGAAASRSSTLARVGRTVPDIDPASRLIRRNQPSAETDDGLSASVDVARGPGTDADDFPGPGSPDTSGSLDVDAPGGGDGLDAIDPDGQFFGDGPDSSAGVDSRPTDFGQGGAEGGQFGGFLGDTRGQLGGGRRSRSRRQRQSGSQRDRGDSQTTITDDDLREFDGPPRRGSTADPNAGRSEYRRRRQQSSGPADSGRSPSGNRQREAQRRREEAQRLPTEGRDLSPDGQSGLVSAGVAAGALDRIQAAQAAPVDQEAVGLGSPLNDIGTGPSFGERLEPETNTGVRGRTDVQTDVDARAGLLADQRLDTSPRLDTTPDQSPLRPDPDPDPRPDPSPDPDPDPQFRPDPSPRPSQDFENRQLGQDQFSVSDSFESQEFTNPVDTPGEVLFGGISSRESDADQDEFEGGFFF